MYETTTRIIVRYGETDQMGVVYYGNYALYFEQGRAAAIKQLGYSYKTMEDEGVIMPVVEMHSKYLKPAKYDDVLTVKTIIRELPTRKMTFYSEIYNGDKLLNTGHVTLMFVNKHHNRITTAPEKLLTLLKPYFE
jgi:acyl-CoA thioester hydrolase